MSISARNLSPARSISPEAEAWPTHTSEMGSLKKLPNRDTAWLGSSSGVYFVNTVRRAFSAAFAESSIGSQDVPDSEDILGGEEPLPDGHDSQDGSLVEGPPSADSLEQSLAFALGVLPDREVATELVMAFFKSWHPLFPFLHGPTFLKDVEFLYSSEEEWRPKSTTQGQNRKLMPTQDLLKFIRFQLITNIASFDRSDNYLPAESRIRSTADVTRLAGVLSLRHDIPTIQTMLAAELYLIAKFALRQASTVAGMILKLIYHAGLHRCPLRYADLQPEDCEIRKRIFWTAYALDRHLSQSLGDPITIQDSDIDVCLSGRELHRPVPRDLLKSPKKEPQLRMTSVPLRSGDWDGSIDSREPTEVSDVTERQVREAALTSYVHYSRLIGRVLEIFHKSVHARFPRRDAIIYLNSDIENWWNDLPGFLSGEELSDVPEHQRQLRPFFSIMYQQLLLLLNRPALSLDPSSADFQHGLQVCIKASRNTLSALKQHKTIGHTMFLPGLLPANWMAGLIIAFACQLGKYQKIRAISDIETCLNLLQSMNSRWHTARHCYQVLSLLLANIKSRPASAGGLLTLPRPEKTNEDDKNTLDASEPSKKRTRTGQSQQNYRHSAAASTGQRTNLAFSESPKADENPTKKLRSSNATISAPTREVLPLQADDISERTRIPAEMNSDFSVSQNSAARFGRETGIASQATNNESQTSKATYLSFEPFMYPQFQPTSNIIRPDLPADDPMLWAPIDYNMADIFGSATWENLMGSTVTGDPNPGNMAFGSWDQNVL